MPEEDLERIIDISGDIWSEGLLDSSVCGVNQPTSQLNISGHEDLVPSNNIPIIPSPNDCIFSQHVNQNNKSECFLRQSTEDFYDTRALFGTVPDILPINSENIFDSKPSVDLPYKQTGEFPLCNSDQFITNPQLCKKSEKEMESSNLNGFFNTSDTLHRQEFHKNQTINDPSSNFDWRTGINHSNNDVKFGINTLQDATFLTDPKDNAYNTAELLNGFPEDLSEYLRDTNAGEMFQELLLDCHASDLPDLDLNTNVNTFFDERFNESKQIYQAYDQNYKVLPYVEASTNTTDIFVPAFKESLSTSTNRSIQVRPPVTNAQQFGSNYDVEKDREKRKRNNEASRKSRAERKFRFKLCEEKVDRLKLENNRLRNLLHDIDRAIEEAKDSLVTKS